MSVIIVGKNFFKLNFSFINFNLYSFNLITIIFPPPLIFIGGGIQGVCSAYYLLKNFGIKATIIEKTSVACAASGKAGGFLAREWGSESTIPLHHHSFDMHKELAQTHSISSYRILPTLSVNSNTTGKKLASWLDGNCTTSHMDDVTAQVTPSEFTGKLLLECTNAGVNFVIGSVNELLFDKTLNKIGGVKLESGETYLADAVLLAMGPWTGVAIEDWLSIPFPMEGIKSSSIILKEINSNDLLNEPYALFCEEDNNNCHLEIYPRPNCKFYLFIFFIISFSNEYYYLFSFSSLLFPFLLF